MKGVANVLANLDKYVDMETLKMGSNMSRAMAEAENNSKRMAPWTDRTGNARNSIFGHVVSGKDSFVGYHGIGMSYGVYLELANQGRYRVIWPTMDLLRNRLLNILANK